MRDDDARLLDILHAARQAVIYTSGVSAERFEADNMVHDAVIRQLEIIGEASRLVTPETRARLDALPWPKMAALRNVLIHEYFQINLKRVWQITQNELPALIVQLAPLVPPEHAS